MLKADTKQIKKNYRIKPQPNFEEREDLKERLYNFSTQTKVSGVFRTSVQNINEAFKGNNPTLINKLKSYIEKMEYNKINSEKSNGRKK